MNSFKSSPLLFGFGVFSATLALAFWAFRIQDSGFNQGFGIEVSDLAIPQLKVRALFQSLLLFWGIRNLFQSLDRPFLAALVATVLLMGGSHLIPALVALGSYEIFAMLALSEILKRWHMSRPSASAIQEISALGLGLNLIALSPLSAPGLNMALLLGMCCYVAWLFSVKDFIRTESGVSKVFALFTIALSLDSALLLKVPDPFSQPLALVINSAVYAASLYTVSVPKDSRVAVR